CAAQVVVPDELICGHLAHDADAVVVGEHLLDGKCPGTGGTPELLDDRGAPGGRPAQLGRDPRHPEHGVIGEELTVPLEVAVSYGLLELLDQLEVLLRAHSCPRLPP